MFRQTPGFSLSGNARYLMLGVRSWGVEVESSIVSTGSQAFDHREILDIKAAAHYLGVSRSHLSHILAGKVPGIPAIPHVRAGRRALIRRSVIDRWLVEQEHLTPTGVGE
jgi:hypothetical protein